MRLCLFEDQTVEDLEPLVLTRPAFELVCGRDYLVDKQCRYFDSLEVGVLIRPYLASLYKLQHPHTPVNDAAWLQADAAILVNARWLPPLPPSSPPGKEKKNTLWTPCVAMIEDEVAYAVVGAEQLAPVSLPPTVSRSGLSCERQTTSGKVRKLKECLEIWKTTLPRRQAGGCLIRYPWNLIEHNAEQLIHDYELTVAAQPDCRPKNMPALVGPSDRL
jgi:hypothetical protein